MKVPNEEFLRAHLEGKTIQFAYEKAKDNEFAWFDLFEERDELFNGTALTFLMTGKQAQGYEIALRIKEDHE